MFSVYDAKAKAYLPPFILPEIGQATRTFGDCVNNKEHQFGAHPSDYSMFKIGTYDDAKGKVDPCHELIGNGVEYLQSEDPTPTTRLETVESLKANLAAGGDA